MTTARIDMWGTRIGAIHWDVERGLGSFEFDRDFLGSGVEPSPLFMPLARRIYSFPALARETFHGLPGMLADVLPDRFGNALIDTWLAAQGRTPDSFNPVERLCYTGARGMGALEFVPAIGEPASQTESLDVAALVELASRILSDREAFAASLAGDKAESALRDILRVGTSAGGARAKAVIAWNPDTGEVRSGTANHEQGYSHWLLKFDGVTNNRDRELAMPQGYGRIEYGYHKMALAAGIDMMECRLLHENGRSHFVTKRFDRTDEGGKLHLQSLGALAHFDFNMAGAYSYEQAILVMRQLHLPMEQIEQQFRRAAFNILARNQDDHVKNIAFLMDKSGSWSLSPAFDVTYNFNPDGQWTSRHQMSLNGKRDSFTLEDFEACGKTIALKRGRAKQIVSEVQDVITAEWNRIAEDASISDEVAERISSTHRRF